MFNHMWNIINLQEICKALDIEIFDKLTNQNIFDKSSLRTKKSCNILFHLFHSKIHSSKEFYSLSSKINI